MRATVNLSVLYLLIWLAPFLDLSAQEKIVVSFNYSGLSFKQFVSEVERRDSVRFFFKDEWVEDIVLGDYGQPVLLNVLLDSLTRNDSFHYYIDDRKNVFITGDLAVKVHDGRVDEEENYIEPADDLVREEKGEEAALFFNIGNPSLGKLPGKVTVSGYIKNNQSGEPVSGATVYIEKLSAGTMSNQYGFYSLSIPRGSHVVRFSFIGMKEKSVHLNIFSSGEMDVEMSSTLVPLREAVITANRSVILQRTEVGVEKIDMATFGVMPTSMGEADIIKSMLLVTGVQSIGEGAVGFNVRGGASDQNLILLYGAPVYNSSHFFGFFSSVNSDVIRDVTLYKGGMPARYGGRISSVLDIETRQGNKRQFYGNAGISPVTTHILLEGPLKKDTASFILAGRTTYSNWVLRLMEDEAIRNSMAGFYDMNAKVSYDPDDKNKFELSSYLSHDAFKLSSDTLYSFDNRIVAVKWQHFFNNRFFSVLTANNSNYHYDVSGNYPLEESFIMSHKINSTGINADFNIYEGRHQINYGLEMTHYTVNPGDYLPASDSSLLIPKCIEKKELWKELCILKIK